MILCEAGWPSGLRRQSLMQEVEGSNPGLGKIFFHIFFQKQVTNTCTENRETTVQITGKPFRDYRETLCELQGNPCTEYREPLYGLQGKPCRCYREPM